MPLHPAPQARSHDGDECRPTAMNFDPTPEQATLYREVLAFAREALDGDVVGPDREGAFQRSAWQRCAEFGLQGLPIPTEYGGLGADATSMMLALEALGYGCEDNGLIF